MGVKEFWLSWLKGDEIKRVKMAWHLAEKIEGCSVIDDYVLRIHCIATFLKSYLEDLEEAIRER